MDILSKKPASNLGDDSQKCAEYFNDDNDKANKKSQQHDCSNNMGMMKRCQRRLSQTINSFRLTVPDGSRIGRGRSTITVSKKLINISVAVVIELPLNDNSPFNCNIICVLFKENRLSFLHPISKSLQNVASKKCNINAIINIIAQKNIKPKKSQSVCKVVFYFLWYVRLFSPAIGDE